MTKEKNLTELSALVVSTEGNEILVKTEEYGFIEIPTKQSLSNIKGGYAIEISRKTDNNGENPVYNYAENLGFILSTTENPITVQMLNGSTATIDPEQMSAEAWWLILVQDKVQQITPFDTTVDDEKAFVVPRINGLAPSLSEEETWQMEYIGDLYLEICDLNEKAKGYEGKKKLSKEEEDDLAQIPLIIDEKERTITDLVIQLRKTLK